MKKFQDILTRQGVTFHFIYHYEFICNISYDYILNLHKICKKMMYNMTIFEGKKIPKISGQISISAVFWGAIPEKLTKFKKNVWKCLVV